MKKTACEHQDFRATAASASTNTLKVFVDSVHMKLWNRMIMRQELRKRGEHE